MRYGSKLLFVAVALMLVLVVPVSAVDADDDVQIVPYISYYDQLDTNGKAVFDAMNGLTPENLGVLDIILPSPMFLGGDDAEDQLDSYLKSMTNKAFYASADDDPMAFWGWGKSTCSYEWEPVVIKSGDTTLTGVVAIKMSFNIDPAYADDPATTDVNELRVKVDELTKAVNEFETLAKDTKSITIAASKYIGSKATYDPNVNTENESPYAHDAYGALVGHDGNKYAVCDGYSEAFVLLTEKYGVKSIIIRGTSGLEGHAWNAVEMEDGKWYGVDATFNDNGQGSDTRYILTGYNTVVDNVKFGVSHIPGIDPAYINGGFSYPTLAKEYYGYTTPTWLDVNIDWILIGLMCVAFSIGLWKIFKS